MLDVEQIRRPIGDAPRAQLDALEVFDEIESTNTYLLNQPPPPPGRFRVALARHQTAGRGRLDRQWHSPSSSGLCLSMSYTFRHAPTSLPCVTLAIGIGIAQALERLGARGVGLKWPNDLVVRDGKLGGILTETRSSGGGVLTVVIGIGINIDLSNVGQAESIRSRIGYASDLASCVRELPSRSHISAALIEALFNSLATFEDDGFADFHAQWDRFDWLHGQRVRVEQDGGIVAGLCQGIDGDGALLLRTDGGRIRILSGSILFAADTAGQR